MAGRRTASGRQRAQGVHSPSGCADAEEEAEGTFLGRFFFEQSAVSRLDHFISWLELEREQGGEARHSEEEARTPTGAPLLRLLRRTACARMRVHLPRSEAEEARWDEGGETVL